MFSPKLAIVTALAAAVLLTGCGKKPATAVDTGVVEERVTPHVPNLASSPKPGSTKKVGVYVDGRWYAKGDEPTAKATAAPAAPTPGFGHLHVEVSLKGLSGFTSSMVIRLKNADDKEVASHTFTGSDLNGQNADGTLTDVPPGSYVMVRDDYNASGGLFNETAYDVEVIADRTVDSSI
jgi:hypothetical protein